MTYVYQNLIWSEATWDLYVTHNKSSNNWPSSRVNSTFLVWQKLAKWVCTVHKVYLQVIISVNLKITACCLHTSPLICLIEHRPVLSTVVPSIILPHPCSALTSGPVGLTDVILHFRTILLCFIADTLYFNYKNAAFSFRAESNCTTWFN